MRTRLSRGAATAGTSPAFTALRQDGNRQQAQDDEQREFAQERVDVKVVGAPFSNQNTRASPTSSRIVAAMPEHHVGDLQPARAPERQFTLQQHEFDRNGGHQRERRQMMKKCE